MSSPAAPAEGVGATVPPSAPGETCPLCGAPLHPDQEWCLRCGAAARTRLAASPNWRAPLLGAIVVAVLSLGVLAAALVKLAGDSGPGAPPRTTTVTTAALAPSTPTTASTLTTTPLPPPASTTTSIPSAPKGNTTGTSTPDKTTSTPHRTSPESIGGLSPALTKRLRELQRQQAQKGK